jgi:hypothetical protein
MSRSRIEYGGAWDEAVVAQELGVTPLPSL